MDYINTQIWENVIILKRASWHLLNLKETRVMKSIVLNAKTARLLMEQVVEDYYSERV